MAELRLFGGDSAAAQLHVIFVHGLGGGIETTWQTKTAQGHDFWPRWLLKDIPRLRTH